MNRNITVDLAKICCAFGVICIHIKSTTIGAAVINDIFWPVCVPFFFCISLFYFINTLSKTDVSNEQIVNKTITRLVIPFLMWTLFYSFILTFKAIVVHQPHKIVWWRALFFGESAVHLYFMANLIVMQAFIYGIWVFTKKKLKGILILTAVALYMYFAFEYHAFSIETPIKLIGWFLFMGSAYLFFVYKDQLVNNKITAILGILILLVAVTIKVSGLPVTVFDYPAYFPFGGIGLAMICLSLNTYLDSSFILTLSKYSFGIYLIHVIILEGVEFLIELKVIALTEYTLISKLLLASTIFIVSTICIHFLYKQRLIKRLLFGEVEK